MTLLPTLLLALRLLWALRMASQAWALPVPLAKDLPPVLLAEVMSASFGLGPQLCHWQVSRFVAAPVAALLQSALSPTRQLAGELPVAKEFE